LAVLGVTAGVELHRRLADIGAAQNVAEYLELFPNVVVDRSPHERVLLIGERQFLVFRSGHVHTPMTDNGATDWSKVKRIYLMAIEAQ